MTALEAAVESPPPQPRPRPAGPARRRPRRAWKAFVTVNEVTHRWLSLLLGLQLIVLTTTGALLLYRSEVEGLIRHGVYATTASSHPLSLEQAAGIVARAHPKDIVTGVTRDVHGAYEVTTKDSPAAYVVDTGTGRINGLASQTGFFAFLDNLHACGLTCSEDPGYLPFLNAPMPGLGIPGLHAVTVSSFLLGLLGLALVYFCVSGLVLWWPTLRRLAQSLTVRFDRGSYRRDRDLHRVVGFAVVPFLLLWGLTGAFYEFPFIPKAAFALQGQSVPVTPSIVSPTVGPTISLARAEASALRLTRGGTINGYTLPDAADPTSTYVIGVRAGIDQWAHYPSESGNYFVGVDRTDAAHAAILYGTRSHTPAAMLFGSLGWGDAVHRGAAFNGWFRLPFFVAGMTPLLLLWTGTATWWFRRRRRRRNQAAA